MDACRVANFELCNRSISSDAPRLLQNVEKCGGEERWEGIEGICQGSADWPGIRVPYVDRTSTERLLAEGNTEGAIGASNACLPKVKIRSRSSFRAATTPLSR